MSTKPAIATDIELCLAGFESASRASLSAFSDRLSELGSKEYPRQISPSEFAINTDEIEGVHGGIQVHADGPFMEFATRTTYLDPADLLADFMIHKEFCAVLVGAALEGRDWIDLTANPRFSERTCPFLWDRAQEFGCSPDFLGGEQRYVSYAVKQSPIREAGLHLHLNLPDKFCDTRSPEAVASGFFPPTNAASCADIARDLAQELRLWHTDSPVGWYRTPGLYRPKSYGIEYRSLGAGIVNSPDNLYAVYRTAFDFTNSLFKEQDKETFV